MNEYFARHPEMMLGRMGLESGQYGDAPALIGTLQPGDLERQCPFCPPPYTRAANGQGSALAARLRNRFPLPARLKKADLPTVMARSSCAVAVYFEPLTVLSFGWPSEFAECSRCVTRYATCSDAARGCTGRNHRRSPPPSKQDVRFFRFAVRTAQRKRERQSVRR